MLREVKALQQLHRVARRELVSGSLDSSLFFSFGPGFSVKFGPGFSSCFETGCSFSFSFGPGFSFSFGSGFSFSFGSGFSFSFSFSALAFWSLQYGKSEGKRWRA